MTDDFITSLRALAKKHPWTVRSAARWRQPLNGADAQALEGALCATERERNEALAEVERLTRELNEARAALKASSCAYPDCVDQGPDGKCTRWLLGQCDPTLEAKP